jgi:hypothetical protein
MKHWNPDNNFIDYFVQVTEGVEDSFMFNCGGEKKTLSETVNEMRLGTSFGQDFYKVALEEYAKDYKKYQKENQ